DVDRLHVAASRLVGDEHRAVEPAGEQYGRRHIISIVMYSVTKRIEFCSGHRLLDYDGVCKHPHGHNATAEIEVRTGTLDNRNMVCDFSDIKRIVKGWIDSELDHKILLRHDDPLVAPLKQLGEPVYLLDSNPTVERIARLIFYPAVAHGLPVARVTVWETPTSFAEFRN